MKSAPQTLFDTNLTTAQKVFGDSSMAFGQPLNRNIYYSVKDGVWSDWTCWECVNGNVGGYPNAVTDDVYVRHNIVSDSSINAVITLNVNNLFIASTGTLRMYNNTGFGTQTWSVNGNIKSLGILDMTSGGVGASYLTILNLYGNDNYVDKTKFTAGTNSSINYARVGDQNIMNLSYYNLNILVVGKLAQNTKYMTSDLVIAGALIQSNSSGTSPTTFECGSYNLTVNGNTTLQAGTFSKNGAGNLLFIGVFSPNSSVVISFSGNPNIEFRGGFYDGFINSPIVSGTGTWSFTTNNQGLDIFCLSFDAPIYVAAGITLTLGNVYGNSNISLNSTSYIDGGAASAFINKGKLNFNAAAAVTNSFLTTTYNFAGFTNTVGYTGNYTATILGASLGGAQYWNLTVTGTGTKTAAGAMVTNGTVLVSGNSSRLDGAGANTIGGALTLTGGTFNINGNTTIAGNTTVSTSTTGGFLNASTYNITFSGTSSFSSSGAVGTFSKSGAGSLTFVGLLTISFYTIDWSGNPTLEFRGGITQTGAGFGTSITFGTGAVSATTNTQTWTVSGLSITLAALTITGAITLNTTASGATYIQVNTVDGTVVGSAWVNKGFFYLNSTTTPMTTAGTYDLTTFANVIGYVMTAAFTIPLTSYTGLAIGGTGLKKLSGNTTIGTSGLYILSATGTFGSGTLDTEANNLTVNGTTTSSGTFNATGAGAFIFVGSCTLANFSWSGNPTAEFRGGFTSSGGPTISSGTGTWTFSTNNQTVTMYFGATPTFDCPILISGAITVTTAANTVFPVVFTNTINGNNAGSTFDNRGYIQYQHATRPMVTGVLQTNAAANIFYYNALGNQDITGGTYRTLTLAGSGVKTLQGNVVVATTYTLTAPATLNLNGFTRT